MLKPNPNLLADNAAAGYGAPILYLPMKDSATAHINEGTGGNFVQNGTLDTASRGANQSNCVASKFDGVDDYLSRTSLTGITDGKQFTLSLNILNKEYGAVGDYIFTLNQSATLRTYIVWSSTNEVQLVAQNSAGVIILNAKLPSMTRGVNYNIQYSVDLSDTLKRKVFVNGLDKTASVTWATYTNDTISLTTISDIRISASSTSYYNGNIGELYFDTRYTDLATNNPFWIED